MDLGDSRQFLPNALRYIGCLIDHGSAVDYVDQASGRRQWILGSDCQQPDGDNCRLAETGGNIEGVRQIPGDHLGPQPPLPPEGRVSSECSVVLVHAPACKILPEIKQLQWTLAEVCESLCGGKNMGRSRNRKAGFINWLWRAGPKDEAKWGVEYR